MRQFLQNYQIWDILFVRKSTEELHWCTVDRFKMYQVPGTKYEVWILNLVTQRIGCRQWTVGKIISQQLTDDGPQSVGVC